MIYPLTIAAGECARVIDELWPVTPKKNRLKWLTGCIQRELEKAVEAEHEVMGGAFGKAGGLNGALRAELTVSKELLREALDFDDATYLKAGEVRCSGCEGLLREMDDKRPPEKCTDPTCWRVRAEEMLEIIDE